MLSNDEWEDVASHSWMVSLIAILFSSNLKNKVDIEKVLKMIIVHDLPEAATGDLAMGETFENKQLAHDKKELEEIAMKSMLKELPLELEKEIYEIWEEFENGSTMEAKLVKALDKLESYFQVSMARDIGYLEKLGSGDLYWKIYCQDLQKHLFEHEPVLVEFWECIKDIIMNKMISIGKNPDNYK